MEEIDIIELLKRAKEGKEPNRIKIGDREYYRADDYPATSRITLINLYRNSDNDSCWSYDSNINLNTKIKILDKPIIEELEPNKCYFKDGTELVYKEMYSKINEIIRVINNKE